MITLHRVEVLTERRIHKASLDDAVMLLEETKNVRKAREEAKLRGMDPEIIEIVDELKLQKEREEEEPLVVDKEDFLKGKIMDIIINLGGDMGVEYDTIVGQLTDFKEDEIDKAVHDLLAEGEIFEPRINRFVRV
jgi:NAD kinase